MGTNRAEKLRLRVAQRPGSTPATALKPRTVPEVFAEVAAMHPNRPAVRAGDLELTYAQLDQAASALAGRIQARRADPTAPVAILLERSVEMAVAALAVLRTGACYVPISTDTPAPRMALILDDVAPSVVVTSKQPAGLLPPDVERLLIDEPSDGPSLRTVEVSPSATAYIIFTSGSTGRPKGVLISHENLTHFFADAARVFDFLPADVWSMFHSFAFDFSVWEMWGALLHGGCVVIVPAETTKDPVEFRRFLRAERVTVLGQTPKAFNQLIDEDSRHADRLPLRRVMLGGDALRHRDLMPWLAKYGDRSPELINLYGMTEATVLQAYRWISARDAHQEANLIGRPLPGLGFLLLDAALRPTPPGETGEVVITGAGVGQGYLLRPELTREKFIELPGPGGPVRAYRTGDLARLGPGGEYEFRGRADDQVKIRGYRIELGDVEAAVAALEDVARAAVIARDLPGFGTSLVAYVVGRDGEPDIARLRSELASRVPGHMIPSVFVALRALPLTPNGKLDRDALPVPTAEPPAPVTLGDDSIDRAVSGLVADLLRLERVDPDAGFFDLGGHSLLATRLLARMRQHFGQDIPLSEFYRSPTARTIAGVIRSRYADSARRLGALEIVKAPAADLHHTTDAQQRLYFMAQLDPESTAYNLHTTLLIEGDLVPECLERAIAEVVRRHAPLRTTYELVDGVPMQRVQPLPAGYRLPRASLSGQPLKSLSAHESARRFDLGRDLMLRAKLVELAPARAALLVTMHHIASDGWSVGIMAREVARLYQAFREGRPTAPSLPELGVTYTDYACTMRAWAASDQAERDLGYWLKRLDNLPEEHGLPLDRPRSAKTGHGSDMLERHLDSGPIEQLCSSQGVTPYVLFQTVLAVVVARRSGKDDVVFATPVANRPFPEVEHLIGLFINMMVVRVQLDGVRTFGELLGKCAQQAPHDLDHQHVPFERLVKRLNPPRVVNRSPLYQIMFVVQNNEKAEPALDGLGVRQVDLVDHNTPVDLMFEVTELESRIRLRWKFDTDLFDASSVAALADAVEALLEQLTGEPAGLDVPLGVSSGSALRAQVATPFPLRRQDGSRPIVAIPGILGFGTSFAQLAAQVTDRSFYSLHTKDIVDAAGADLEVSALVDGCVTAIAGIEPNRPVDLLGHSMGGLLAVHVAHELHLRGRAPATVVLLDPAAPSARDDTPAVYRFLSAIEHLLPPEVREAGPAYLTRWSGLGDRAVLEQAQGLLDDDALKLFDGDLRAAFRSFQRVTAMRWPPAPQLTRPVLLVSAAGAGAHGAAAAGHWTEHADKLEHVSVVATHEGMLRGQPAKELAGLLADFAQRTASR